MRSLAFSISAIFLSIFCILAMTWAGSDGPQIQFHPIKHASMVIESSGATIYVDPVGDISAFEMYPKPDLILITDIHQDHLNKNVVESLKKPDTFILGSKDAVDALGEGKVLNNGESYTYDDIHIQAIPAYNLSDDRKKFHPKGRGNGYVITLSDKRIYISGDTEDIPEMKALKNIDYAFICMNLPYTMTEEQAASAVLAFKPKTVFPYHYRGKNGMSDLEKFKRLVTDSSIQVKILDWY